MAQYTKEGHSAFMRVKGSADREHMLTWQDTTHPSGSNNEPSATPPKRQPSWVSRGRSEEAEGN